MKQTSSFQRWHKRYFKLKGHKLYYAKDTKVSTDSPDSFIFSCVLTFHVEFVEKLSQPYEK